jgi:hypothetical protein
MKKLLPVIGAIFCCIALLGQVRGPDYAPNINNGGNGGGGGTAGATSSPFAVNGSAVPGTAAAGQILGIGPGGTPVFTASPAAAATAWPGPSINGVTFQITGAQTSVVVSVPSPIVNGDMSVMHIVVQSTQNATPCPAGWTAKGSATLVGQASNWNQLCSIAVGATVYPTPTITDASGVIQYKLLNFHKPANAATAQVSFDQITGNHSGSAPCASPSPVVPTGNNSLIVFANRNPSNGQIAPAMNNPIIGPNAIVYTRVFEELANTTPNLNFNFTSAYQQAVATPMPTAAVCNPAGAATTWDGFVFDVN